MLTDGIVNYIISNVRRVSKLDEVPLIEKTISNKKIKLTFQRDTIKHIVEFGTKELVEVIYLNFINETFRERITFEEFQELYESLLANSNVDVTDSEFEALVNDCCENLLRSKLF